MKRSTIKLVLRNKIKSIAESIVDEDARKAFTDNVIVSGGAIASMLMGDKVNDYDLYLRNKEAVIKLANYYIDLFNATNKLTYIASHNVQPCLLLEKRFNIRNEEEDRVVVYMKSSGVASETQTTYKYFETQGEESEDEFMASLRSADDVTQNPVELMTELVEMKKSDKKPAFRPVFFTENAITLSDKCQLVIRFFGEPDQIHSNYDYAHAMCYFDYKNDRLELHPDALESMLSKNLIYRGSLYPIASIFRLRKFIARGWRITAGQILKIIWQINQVDLSDPGVLREQLIGVDQAYMTELLRALENKDKEQRIDEAYLSKLIDQIFEDI